MMSIDQPNQVDLIGVETRSGKVILTISDHLDWTDERSHLFALQDKMNTYIRFIESGELVSAYPGAAGRKAVIDVVTRLEVPRACVQFFERVRPTLDAAGIELRTRVLPDAEAT